jgi:spore maturation protein CgeB
VELINMRILCVFGRYNYGDPSRGEGYEYSNFLPAFRRLGHDILLFDSWDRSQYHDFGELNLALLQTVEQFQPDVIFSVLFMYEIWLEIWQMLRDSGTVATVNWTTDDSWKYAQFSRLVAPYFHAFTTTYPSMIEHYHADGIQHTLLTQWAANAAQLHPPKPASQCQFKVSFVGTAHGERRAWIEELKRRGIEVSCFGHGWTSGPVAAHAVPRILRDSVISLNFANSTRQRDGIRFRPSKQIKARTFEVPGVGGFLLSEDVENLSEFYSVGHEIETFSTLDELSDKIVHYLNHPQARDEIAYAGYLRTASDHTYDVRMRDVIEHTLKMKRRYFESRVAISQLDIPWSSFTALRRQHTMNGRAKMLRQSLVAIGSLLWGRSRGPRAARRLIYELSWRICGAQTYTAKSWPGRMFYDIV